MIKPKIKMSILTMGLFTILLLSNFNFKLVSAESKPNYASFVNSIRNISVNQTEGKLLNTKSETINENGTKYEIVEDGQTVSAKIEIKDSHITGSLSTNGTEYLLNGALDEVNGKYTGTVTNFNGYTFEAYITDVSKGYVLINIFDQDKKPQSYEVSDKKAIKTKTVIPQTTIMSPMVINDMHAQLLQVGARGMYYSVQGPKDGVVKGTWEHNVLVRTEADQAWADSGINSLIHYAAVVIYNKIQLDPYDVGTNIRSVAPAQTGSTQVSFPFYLGEYLGIQTVPLQTSTTTVTKEPYGAINEFTWGAGIAYLDEAGVTYTPGKLSFGSAFNWSTTNTGSRETRIIVALQYELIAKSTDTSPNTYAYPSYSSTSNYYVQVN